MIPGHSGVRVSVYLNDGRLSKSIGFIDYGGAVHWHIAKA